MNRFLHTKKILAFGLLAFSLTLTGCLTDDKTEETGGPTISVSPTDQLVSVGSTATFTVTATGTGALTYQWMKDGTNIAGATTSTYTFTAGNSDDGAEYKVKVTDSKGSTTSQGAFLRIKVKTEAVITLGAQSNNVFASSLDLDTWTTYTAANAPGQSSNIDLVFAYSTAQDSSAIYSPKAAKDGVGGSSGFDFMQSWTTTNNTEFKAVSMTDVSFGNVNTASEIKSLFDGATAPTPAGRVFVKNGTVIVAKSNSGLYVLIRVTSVVQSAAGTASLTGKAKW